MVKTHLVESAQTSQNAATKPSAILAVRGNVTRMHPNPRVGKHARQIRMQPIGHLFNLASAAGEHDVAEQVGADLHVDGVEARVDQVRQRHLGLGLRVRGVVERGLVVEEALGHLEALDAEDLVPAVGHLKGARRERFGRVRVWVVGHGVGCFEFAWPLPYLHH